MMHILLSCLGAFAICVASIYFDRVRVMSKAAHRLDYIVLHSALGAGAIVVGVEWLAGAQVTLDNLCILTSAVSYLLVTHRRGCKFRPPDYMHSHRGDL